jgi:hypothetical protein
MQFKKSYFAYLLVGMLFLVWGVVLAIGPEQNQLFTYGILQLILYACIILDLYSQDWLRLIAVIGFVYKCFVFIYGLQWIKDITGISVFEMAVDYKWQHYSLITKATFFDLMLMICILTTMVCIILLICVSGCMLVCISPFLPEEYLVPGDRKEVKIQFEKCFSETKSPVKDICCICLVEFDEQNAQSNSCGHVFHKRCIKEWIGTGQSNCPICKQEFGTCRILVAIDKV